MSAWFDIDRQGLAALVGRREDKSFVFAELVQNAWDAPGVRRVEVDVAGVPGQAKVSVGVVDDSPVGFVDLTHAFTLFASSAKKGDPTLRGRFNFGEKLVLSICDEATIETTTGTVHFDGEGRRVSRRRRESGTRFHAILRMTRAEMDAAVERLRTFIPPSGTTTVVNGVAIPAREALRSFDASLPTEIADESGVLRRRTRRTVLTVYRPVDGGRGHVYEMGLPVAETGDAFDVDVAQKIPLTLERDGVAPAFLEKLRVAVASATHDLLTAEDVTSSWVGEALASRDLSDEAASSIVRRRFGERVVSYDPSDREANDLATSKGYVVLAGGSLSRDQWATVRRTGLVQPAGRVTPSPKPFSPDGPPAEDVEPTEAMSDFRAFTVALARRLMGVDVTVRFLKSFNAVAAYGSRQICFNVSRLGSGWFEAPLQRRHIDLLIHEFGHEYEMNHLSSRYLDALTRLGGECTMAAIEDPALFDLVRHRELRLAPAPDGRVSRTEIVLHLKTPAAQSRLRMALREGSAPAFALSSELSRRFHSGTT